MLICGLDTETTGLPNAKLDPTDPRQARVVQLALKLMTTDQRVICQFSTLIKPSGWDEIHPKAYEAHGITREDCDMFGIEADKAFNVFLHYASLSDKFIAHNAPFDLKMMRMESKALKKQMPETPWHCTMEEATPVCKIPPTAAMVRSGRNHFKNANLTEALKVICDKEMVGAHDAMNDVNACMEVFFGLRKRVA